MGAPQSALLARHPAGSTGRRRRKPRAGDFPWPAPPVPARCVTTDDRHRASALHGHLAAMAARHRCSGGTPSGPASPARAAIIGPCAAMEPQVGTIVTHHSTDCMIIETWTSDPRTPSGTRRFVIIYRRRHLGGHRGRGRTLDRRDDLRGGPGTPTVAPCGAVAVSN